MSTQWDSSNLHYWQLSGSDPSQATVAPVSGASTLAATTGIAANDPGDHVFSIDIDALGSSSIIGIGLVPAGHDTSNNLGGDAAAVQNNGTVQYHDSGTNSLAYGGTFATALASGQTIYVRLKAGKAYFKQDAGNWYGTSSTPANPDTDAGGADMSYHGSDPLYPAVFAYDAGTSVTGHFDAWEAASTPATAPLDWVVDPHDFGAKGDAVFFRDGAVTGHGTSTPKLHSVSHTFTPDDIGKELHFTDYSGTHTITAVQSGDAVFSPDDVANTTGTHWRAGTDDTAAINAAIVHAADLAGRRSSTQAVVKLRSGRAYLVSNSQSSYNNGTHGCITLLPRVALEGWGESYGQTTILCANGCWGHVIWKQGETSSLGDFISLANLRILCFGGDPNGNQLDGVNLQVAFDGYEYTDTFNRIRKLFVQGARRDGIFIGGTTSISARGELQVEDVNCVQNGRYGLYVFNQNDFKVMGGSAGGNSKTGVRIENSGGQWSDFKSYFNGAGGGASEEDSANWFVWSQMSGGSSGPDYYNGSNYFSNCMAQESRGSAWVIAAANCVLDGCVAADPGRVNTDHVLDHGDGLSSLPPNISGFRLKGPTARLNVFNGCLVTPTLTNYSGNQGVSGAYTTQTNWGNAKYAVCIGDTTDSPQPQQNRGDIYTEVGTTNAPGITYPSGGGAVGGSAATATLQPKLRVDGNALP